MKDLINIAVVIVMAAGSTAAVRSIHDAVRKAALEKAAQGLTPKKQGAFAVTISVPERAMMEYLYLVPQEESFDEGVLLMEGLTSLRPKIVHELLERCTSIKVNRLFLYLAERGGHSWFKKLDIKKVELGRGKKQIVKGVRYHHCGK